MPCKETAQDRRAAGVSIQIVMENGLLLTGQIHGKARRVFPGLVVVMLGDSILCLCVPIGALAVADEHGGQLRLVENMDKSLALDQEG